MIGVQWRQHWEATRSVWQWPVIIIASAIAVILFTITDLTTPVRAVIGFWFVLVCPGMAFVRFLRIEDPLNEFMLAVAVSIGLGATLATAMAVTQNWSPDWGVAILAYVSIVGAVLQLTTAGVLSRPGAVSSTGSINVRARMRLYFGSMIAALMIAVISGAALAWDGSYHFFKLLDLQRAFVAHNRLIMYPTHSLTIFFSHYVDNLSILQLVYGLAYCFVSLGSLALCWWIARRRSPSLFIWPALGISIGVLPGQFALVFESTMVVQLFWPVMMIVINRIQNRHAPLLVLLAIVMVVAHPLSLPLLVMAVVLMFVVGIFDKYARLKMWLWAFVFIVLGLFAALHFLQTVDSYKSEWLTINFLVASFRNNLRGYSIAALMIVWVVALLVAARPMLVRLRQRVLAHAYVTWEFIGIATAAALFFVWAVDPLRWSAELGYRHWVVAGSLPFIGLAALESLRQPITNLREAQAEWNHRSQIVLCAGVICLLTLSAQSVGWIQITQHLQGIIAQSPTACVPASSIEWLNRTPLNHFSLTTYSLVIQGRTPEKVVLPDNACSQTDFTTGFPLTEEGDWREWEGGWFDMRRLRERILNEQEVTIAGE